MTSHLGEAQISPKWGTMIAFSRRLGSPGALMLQPDGKARQGKVAEGLSKGVKTM